MKLENSYAIIIGISEFNSKDIKNLNMAAKDAEDITKILCSKDTGGFFDENVVCLTNSQATKAQIWSKLDSLKPKLTKDSLLLFYFSGHGAYNEERNYFIPLYEFNKVDSNTMLLESDILTLFSSLSEGKVVFIFDACQAGKLTKDNELHLSVSLPDALIDKVFDGSATSGKVLIASSMQDEKSWEVKDLENGLFTHCLLKALSGECPVQMNGEILILDLVNYLLTFVSQTAESNGLKQICNFKVSRLNTNFPICVSPNALVKHSKSIQLQFKDHFVHAVLDLQEDHEQMEKEFISCLKRRTLDSKLVYWGSEVTKKYIDLMNSRDYSLPEKTTSLLEANIDDIIDNLININKPIRVIGLGIGDGRKDAIVLKKLIKKNKNKPVEYWIIDISYDMIRIGINNIRAALTQADFNKIEIRVLHMDFLKISEIQKILEGQKQNFFLLLGNTLGNFKDDGLLAILENSMHPGDWLLLDNQLKKPGELSDEDKNSLLEIYNNDKYKEYLSAILRRSGIGIEPKEGEIRTTLRYEKNINLRIQDSITVNQEYISKIKQVILRSGELVIIPRDSIITLVYSRKYVFEELQNLIKIFFQIVKSYPIDNQYALILSKKAMK